ncbi:MAG: VCBS repeat-containing protein [Bacteroidetes bacterium]|nr:VCBS repeat-containing protein [Bacteroidota bacterium]
MKKIYLFIMNLKSGKNFLPGLCFSYNKILPQNFCIKSVLQFIGGLFVLLLISSHGYSQGFTSKGKLLYKDTISLGERAAPDFADVDGDGDIDLFVGTDDYRIAIFSNDGNGNFEASGNFQYNDGIESVGNHPHPAFADLDGDSDLDLYLGYNGGAIIVIEQIGPEDFEEIGFLNVEGASFSVAGNTTPYFVDLDRDADLDLAVGDANGVVHICYNDGSGVFTLHDTLEANGSYIDVGNNSSPAFGDADGDGDIDIYVGNEDGKIEIFSNDGSGIFSSEGYFTVNDETVDVGTFANPTFGNIDRDGVLELYIGNQDTTIYVFTNDGSGNFSASGVFKGKKGEISFLAGSGEYASPEFVDLDGDDDLDLYIGNVDGYIAKYYNDESGIFDWGGFMQADENIIDVGDRAHPTFADLDSDDDLDLYVGESSGTVIIYTNDGSGDFTAAGAFQSDGNTLKVIQQANPVFADIDGDDDLDLYVGEYLGHIHVYLNDGVGTFSESDRLQAGGSDIDVGEMPSPFFIDIDNDNDLDLYVSNHDGNILMYENDGEGTFLEGDTLKADGAIISANNDVNIAFANLNGSCIPNLYLGNVFGNIYEYESFDITPPAITSEWTNFTKAMDDNCEATLDDYISSLQVSDNCDSELDMVQTPTSGTALSYGNNPVKIVVTDDGGYSDSISFNVIAFDDIDPVIMSSHDDQTLIASASCDATLPDYKRDVTAEDNCDLELDITQSPVAGTLISGSDQVITLIATDNDGNFAEYEFFVSVEDQTDPVITCANDTTVTADSDGNFSVGFFLDPEVTDNCIEGALPTVSNSYNSNATLNDISFSVGEYVITWTATDEASNTASCSITLTVEEEEDEGDETGIFDLVKERIVIYPNPISNALNIKLDDPSNIEEIRIYDVAGRQLYINEYIFETNLTIDMNRYNSGLYLIQIKTIDNTFSKKIIKE